MPDLDGPAHGGVGLGEERGRCEGDEEEGATEHAEGVGTRSINAGGSGGATPGEH